MAASSACLCCLDASAWMGRSRSTECGLESVVHGLCHALSSDSHSSATLIISSLTSFLPGSVPAGTERREKEKGAKEGASSSPRPKALAHKMGLTWHDLSRKVLSMSIITFKPCMWLWTDRSSSLFVAECVCVLCSLWEYPWRNWEVGQTGEDPRQQWHKCVRLVFDLLPANGRTSKSIFKKV